MVSDQELASCVESLLRQGGPAAVNSVNGVVHQLEAKFGMDLSHKASFIHDQIDVLLGPRFTQLPGASSAGSHHFSQIPLSAHLPSHSHDPSARFAAQVSQATAAAVAAAASATATATATAAPHEHLDHQKYLPRPVAAHAPPPPRTSARAPKESVHAAPKRRGGPGGLCKVCRVSAELQVIVGEPTMARTEIVKQLWAYIRKNNLQDPNNKRKIICNDELRLVFETDSTDMFKMNKLLAKHIITLEPSKEPVSDSKRLKRSDKEVGVSLEIDASQYPVVISDALAEFFGMGEREILQSEAFKRVSDYIKAKHLEDSMNNMILCDNKLQQLFGCESLFTSNLSEIFQQKKSVVTYKAWFKKLGETRLNRALMISFSWIRLIKRRNKKNSGMAFIVPLIAVCIFVSFSNMNDIYYKFHAACSLIYNIN
ncbi:hypothetical protein IEQ34_011840 [Dendrobium chrysotoxum]|uniref:Uncharacterized protein n=1 Tax=Dendrobium chrysotoxum TaxID=161865 RepID=A0AAV7GQY2_DENCH|nr:hypothetical protein IEQ34_011840 [Dendrobium chrysotoxum]